MKSTEISCFSPIRDWPAAERPREKLLHKGAAALTDAELLAIFLRTGSAGSESRAFRDHAALAAVIIVSAVSLFDLGTLRQLYGINRSEFAFSAGTTLGVLVLGVLPGVLTTLYDSTCPSTDLPSGIDHPRKHACETQEDRQAGRPGLLL